MLGHKTSPNKFKRTEITSNIFSEPQEYLEVMNIKEDKKVFLFDYFGFDKNRELVEYTISYHLPQYSKYSFVTKIEHRK